MAVKCSIILRSFQGVSFPIAHCFMVSNVHLCARNCNSITVNFYTVLFVPASRLEVVSCASPYPYCYYAIVESSSDG